MKEIHLSYKKVQRMVKSIADNIKEDDWQPDYIVGITRGGLLPANLLSQYLKTKMYSLDVCLRDHTDGMGPESNCWMSEDALDDKNILIVDDINDTGATLNWIVDDWKRSNQPHSPDWEKALGNNVRIAALVENKASKFKGVSYYGKLINKAEDDAWCVFPWEEWWKDK